MTFDFLQPVSDSVLAHNELQPDQSLGKQFVKHTVKSGVPEIINGSLVLLTVEEQRTAFGKRTEIFDASGFRNALYPLFMGNWAVNLVDLGSITAGDTLQDTEYLLTTVVEELHKKDCTLIVVGAVQGLTYATYRGFDRSGKMVHLAHVDSKFDLSIGEEMVVPEAYLSRIITQPPNHLYHLTQLGYQSYYVAQEELDLLDQLHFELYRLGALTSDIRGVEPLLRSVDLLSVDMKSVEASALGEVNEASPNGFTGREICALMRYAGIGDTVKVAGIYEVVNNAKSNALAAQMIWYFMEGYSLRTYEEPTAENPDFLKFNVPTDAKHLVFYKSLRTERWWLQVPKGNFE
jgi:arginase family enzyme